MDFSSSPEANWCVLHVVPEKGNTMTTYHVNSMTEANDFFLTVERTISSCLENPFPYARFCIYILCLLVYVKFSTGPPSQSELTTRNEHFTACSQGFSACQLCMAGAFPMSIREGGRSGIGRSSVFFFLSLPTFTQSCHHSAHSSNACQVCQ